MPATRPPDSQLRSISSCASPWSLTGPSPCTLLEPGLPSTPPSAPFAVIAEIALTAAATSISSAARSLAPSTRSNCSIRNFDSVVRPRYMVETPSDFVLSGRDLENAARADVGLGDSRQILGGEFPIH